MKPAVAIAAIALGALLLAGCQKKQKPVSATAVWLGPTGGCVAASPPAPILSCWGVNDAGQIGDGTTEPRPFARALDLQLGPPLHLSFGARHTCGLFDLRGEHRAFCWGDGKEGQLGTAIPHAWTPYAIPSDRPDQVIAGGAHTCVRTGERLHCFGADDEGQLGREHDGSDRWFASAPIRSVALGDAHTCVAYGRGKEAERVVCHGRKTAAPAEPLLVSTGVKALAAGAGHTCALREDGAVQCWGKNEAGQLGDGTTNDSLAPVTVLDVTGAVAIASGARHVCAILWNGLVTCWGANDRNQLSNGTRAPSGKAGIVVGLVQSRQLSAGGDGTCVRLDGGYVRCWGANDRSQLGDGSQQEHNVPMPIKHR